jgi:hypothetical protein
MFIGELPPPRAVPFAWSAIRIAPPVSCAVPDQTWDDHRQRIGRLATTSVVIFATLAVSTLMLVLAAHA